MEKFDKIQIIRQYANIPAGTLCDFHFKVADDVENFYYIVYHPTFVFPVLIPERYFK